jgi:DNA-binding transcriptional LysR family regulator
VPVKNAIDEIERIVCSRSDFDPRTVQRTFRMVCSDYVYAVFVTRLVRQLAEIAPNIILEVLLLSEGAIALLEERTVDFLVVPSGLMSHDHPSLALFNDTFSCIAWLGNAAVQDTISREQYLNSDHVGTILGVRPPKHFEPFEEPDHDEQPRNIVRTPTFSAMADTVIGTSYLATIQTRLASLLAERLPLRVLDLPVSRDPFVERLQWHRNKDNDPGTVWLRNLMVSVAASF